MWTYNWKYIKWQVLWEEKHFFILNVWKPERKNIKYKHTNETILTKPSNIEDPNKTGWRFKRKTLIYPVDHMIKKMAVDSLRQGITSVVRLLYFQGHPVTQGRTDSQSLRYQMVTIMQHIQDQSTSKHIHCEERNK